MDHALSPLPVDAWSGSQLVPSRVAPLLAEQKRAEHGGAVLRFVLAAARPR
jgi:hypothetical protein